MKLADKLSENRRRFEREMRALIGSHISIPQLSIFALACGCSGLTIVPGGIVKDDVVVFESHIMEKLREMFSDLEIDPKCIYSQTMPPSFSDVRGIRAVNLCDRCASEIGEGKSSPEIDFLLLEKGGGSIYNFSERRGELEEELRNLTGIAVHVPELGIYAMSCGCKGIEAEIIGLQMEEIKNIDKGLSSYLKRMTEEFELNPKIAHARARFGGPEVFAVTVRDLCDDCKRKYEKIEERKDFYVLEG
ncbi:MAG: DUF5402 family protein [Candidatus Syntropharchaeia archaeon]